MQCFFFYYFYLFAIFPICELIYLSCASEPFLQSWFRLRELSFFVLTSLSDVKVLFYNLTASFLTFRISLSLGWEGVVSRYLSSSFSVFFSLANLSLGRKGTVFRYSTSSFSIFSSLASLFLGCKGTVPKYLSSSFNVHIKVFPMKLLCMN